MSKKVALFIPCLTEHLFPESGLSMVKVLNYYDVSTEYVEDQTCCGQPAFNSGYRREIIPAAERFIRLFQNYDYVVAPSGSCVAMVRIFYKELHLSDDVLSTYEVLKNKIFEFSEFLVDILEVTEIGGSFAHKVTYHDSCHLARELGVREQPRQLIKGVGDINFVEMEQSDTCCGFGGTFSYKYKDVSVAMVEQKCRFIKESGAEFCIGADSSCLMNIEGYLRKNNFKAKTLHIADLVARSLKL